MLISGNYPDSNLILVFLRKYMLFFMVEVVSSEDGNISTLRFKQKKELLRNSFFFSEIYKHKKVKNFVFFTFYILDKAYFKN